MKNTATNMLGYTGIVTLSQYINGKQFILAKVHNKGGEALFNFLADCLSGDFETASKNMPIKISLINKSIREDGEPVSDTSGYVRLRTAPVKVKADSESSTVRYSFIVPQEYLHSGDFNCVRLYADSAQGIDDFAAEVDADELQNVAFTASSVLVVDWELIISN